MLMQIHNMNIFRFTGDIIHLSAIILLIVTLLKTRSCVGVSGRTQILYALVFITRYLDLATTFISVYNFTFKIVFISLSIITIFLIYGKFRSTYISSHDTLYTQLFVIPCLLLALYVNYVSTFTELAWTFSIYLEAIAIVPQLMLMCHTTKIHCNIKRYVALLGYYRALYIMNWIARYHYENFSNVIAESAGVVQVMIYILFYFYYRNIQENYDCVTIEKTQQTRLEETKEILCHADFSIPANKVRSEWSSFIERTIDAAGWQALWKAPESVCKELKLEYPTALYGTVVKIELQSLIVTFSIEDLLKKGETSLKSCEVPLEELWPIHYQRNGKLNIEKIADSVDKLRFFYDNIWMPWDGQNNYESNWAEAYLETRIQLFFEIENRKVPRALTTHLNKMLMEAKRIQKRREQLELDVYNSNKNELTELNLQLNTIQNEVEILENSELRKFVIKDYVLEVVEVEIEKHYDQLCPTLQEALYKTRQELCISTGTHSIGSAQDMAGPCAIQGTMEIKYTGNLNADHKNIHSKTSIYSQVPANILFSLDGHFTFENVVIDCEKTRTGILVKGGNITFKNCILMGNTNYRSKQGIVALGDSVLSFENCVIKNFVTGIYIKGKCNIEMKDTIITDCLTGIELVNDIELNFVSSKILNCRDFGLVMVINEISGVESGVYDDYCTIKREELTFEGKCEFKDNQKGNIAIYNFHASPLNEVDVDNQNIDFKLQAVV